MKFVARSALVCLCVGSFVLACASEQPPIDDGTPAQPTSTNTATTPPPPPPPTSPRDAGTTKQCPSTCTQDSECQTACQAPQTASIWCCDKASSKICFQYAPDGGSGCPTTPDGGTGPY